LAIALNAEFHLFALSLAPDYSCILLIKKDTGKSNGLTEDATALLTFLRKGYYSNPGVPELPI
jgi:hypothetical protein